MKLPKEVLRRNPLVRFGRSEGRQEGRYLGESRLVLQLLIRRLGMIPSQQQQAIRRLPLKAIETLGEALLDFETRRDLVSWLDMRDMQLSGEVLRRNPLVRLGRAEGCQEGRHLGESKLVLRLLIRRLGSLPSRQQQAIRRLPLQAIEALGEALLDFKTRRDLSTWLSKNSKK